MKCIRANSRWNLAISNNATKIKFSLVGDSMTVIKILELVGNSEKAWEDAAQEALREAAKTVEHIVGIDALGYKGEVKENKI